MSFEQRLHRTVDRAATEVRHTRGDRTQATQTVALLAPHVLRRYAEIAAAFAANGLPSAQGAISARHDDRYGYHEVEYDAPDLHIRFGLGDGAPHLHWCTASNDQDRLISAEAGRTEIDAALLEATTAVSGARARADTDGTDQPS